MASPTRLPPSEGIAPDEGRPDLSGLRIQRAGAPKTKRAPLWLVLLVVGVGLLLVLGYVYMRRLPAAAPAEVAAMDLVTVPAVGQGPGVVLSGSGYVEAQVRADISAKIPGRLEFLEVEEGDRVRAGELLAQLENRDYRARRDLAERELVERRAAVAEAEAILVEDQREFERQKRLVAGGVSGEAERERAEARRDASKARLDSARAAVASAAARVAVTEAELENTLIRAPFAGVVIRKMAKVGEMVMPQSLGADTNTKSGIVQLADFNTLEVEVDVQEANIARLEEGQPARVLLKSYRERPYEGVLRQILPTADRAQGTVLVRVRILNPDERVLPKMQADVDFLRPERTADAVRELPRIPREAVLERDGKRYVLVLEGEILREREIELGETLGAEVEVRRGLSGGEQIARAPAELPAAVRARARREEGS
jgi:RND family efflux transporter MFP subunit